MKVNQLIELLQTYAKPDHDVELLTQDENGQWFRFDQVAFTPDLGAVTLSAKNGTEDDGY